MILQIIVFFLATGFTAGAIHEFWQKIIDQKKEKNEKGLMTLCIIAENIFRHHIIGSMYLMIAGIIWVVYYFSYIQN